jgi:glyoxylase-like metal-dependent hydrolase (beta-lactamase superfamily II)
VLFTGDVATENQGYVILGPFNYERAKARESFRRFADIDVDTVCFGHGQPLQRQGTQKLRDAALADQVPDPRG